MFKNANFFITEFFRSLIGKQPAENITPKIAVAIQKQDYFNSLNEYEKTFTPPYLQVSYQLLNEKTEVFEAAVYYLCIISKNMPKYKDDIYNILTTYCNNNKKRTDRVSFIQSEMKKYKLF